MIMFESSSVLVEKEIGTLYGILYLGHMEITSCLWTFLYNIHIIHIFHVYWWHVGMCY